MTKRAEKQQSVLTTGPAPMPAMPMANMNVGQEMAKSIDPNWEESQQLQSEATRALKRLLIHEVTHGRQFRVSSISKALEALRGY